MSQVTKAVLEEVGVDRIGILPLNFDHTRNPLPPPTPSLD